MERKSIGIIALVVVVVTSILLTILILPSVMIRCVQTTNYYCDQYFDTGLQQYVYRWNRQLVWSDGVTQVDCTTGMLSLSDCNNLITNPELAENLLNCPAVKLC